MNQNHQNLILMLFDPEKDSVPAGKVLVRNIEKTKQSAIVIPERVIANKVSQLAEAVLVGQKLQDDDDDIELTIGSTLQYRRGGIVVNFKDEVLILINYNQILYVY